MKVRLLIYVTGVVCVLTSCVPVALGTGTAAAAYATRSEKGIGGKVSDAELTFHVSAMMAKLKAEIRKDLFFVVKDKRLLLTGTVSSAQDKQTALKVFKKIKNLEGIHDEIQIGERYSTKERVDDNLKIADINTRMLFTKGIKALNYKLIVFKNNVYILGIASSQEEMDKILDVVRKNNTINRVFSYVNFR